MSYRKIQAALETQLNGYTGSIVIAQSDMHKPKPGQSFSLVRFLPGKSKNILIGSNVPQVHMGVYQIDIHDESEVAALTSIDKFRALFPAGKTLTFEGLDVSITKSNLSQDRRRLSHIRYSLDILWRSYF
jgi:Bacteriophage related domain of unknown function